MLSRKERFRNLPPSASKVTASMKQTVSDSDAAKLTIDFPKEGECITSTHYSFKVSALVPVVKVETSVDGGGWVPCREASGYWWSDWNGFSNKTYTLQARAYSSDGKQYLSSVLSFIVNTNPTHLG